MSTHWLAAKNYLAANLNGEGSTPPSAQSAQVESGNNGSGNGTYKYGVHADAPVTPASSNVTPSLTASGVFAHTPQPVARKTVAGSTPMNGLGAGNGNAPGGLSTTYNPGGQPGAMFHGASIQPGGGGGGGGVGSNPHQRNILLEKITSLESQQLTLISQLMAQKEEMGRFAIVKTQLERDLTDCGQANESAQKEIQQLQHEKATLQKELNEFEICKHNLRTTQEQVTKLTTERAWFEKRYVQSQEYKQASEDGMALLQRERDELQAKMAKLEELSTNSSAKDQEILAQLRQQLQVASEERDKEKAATRRVEREFKELEEEFNKNLTTMSEQLQQIYDLEEKQRIMQQDLTKARTDITEYKATIQQHVTTIQRQEEECKQHTIEINNYRLEVQRLTKLNEDLSKTNTQVVQELGEQHALVRDLQLRIDELEEELSCMPDPSNGGGGKKMMNAAGGEPVGRSAGAPPMEYDENGRPMMGEVSPLDGDDDEHKNDGSRMKMMGDGGSSAGLNSSSSSAADGFGRSTTAARRMLSPSSSSMGRGAGAGANDNSTGSGGIKYFHPSALELKQKEYDALQLQHTALKQQLEEAQVAKKSLEETVEKLSHQQGGGNGLNSTDLVQSQLHALPPRDREFFFIPSNLHALPNEELITLIMSLKDTLVKIQDTHDTLASKNFLLTHQLHKLDQSRLRNIEIQKYLHQQEQVFLVKSTTLQRDLTVVQQEYDELIRKVATESSDVILRAHLHKCDTAMKNQADLLKKRDHEVDQLQAQVRDAEHTLKVSELQFRDALHEAETRLVHALQQERTEFAHRQRTWELRNEEVRTMSTHDINVMRAELIDIFEARLSQQHTFWSEKEKGWFTEKALLLREWQKEESEWSKEKDVYEQLRLTHTEQRRRLEEENQAMWSEKLRAKDEACEAKLVALQQAQYESDKIIRGMEIQWKRRVEEWAEKEAILLAAVKRATAAAAAAGANLPPMNGTPMSPQHANTGGASSYEQDFHAHTHGLLTEREKEVTRKEIAQLKSREKELLDALTSVKVSESTWRKEKASLTRQVDVLEQEMRSLRLAVANTSVSSSASALVTNSTPSSIAEWTLSPQPKRIGPVSEAYGRGQGAKGATQHFASSSAFHMPDVPIPTATDFASSIGSATGMPRVGLGPLVEQDYQRRIDQLQATVEALQLELQQQQGKSNLDSTLNLTLASSTSASSSSNTISMLQQRLDEKQKEVYALNRRNQRLEEELLVLQRKSALAFQSVSEQSHKIDATTHFDKMTALQHQYETEIQQLRTEHLNKSQQLHHEYDEQLTRAREATKKVQADYLRNLSEIQESHSVHLQTKENEIEQLKQHHHTQLKTIQQERLDELQRHNTQVLHYQKEKSEQQRLLDARTEEMKLLEAQLHTSEESIKLLEQQLTTEKERLQLVGSQAASAASAAASGAAREQQLEWESHQHQSWQKEKRQLLEAHLQAENAHAEEMERLNARLTSVENELDREREKNKILYTQIQILSERNVKVLKRQAPTPKSLSSTRGIDHEHQALLDELDPERRVPLSARAKEMALNGQFYGSGGAGAGGSVELAQLAQEKAELEQSHYHLHQEWMKEKSLLESHIAHLQTDLEQTSADKNSLITEVTRVKNEYALLEKQSFKYQRKVDILQQHLNDHLQAKQQMQTALQHLQTQYQTLTSSVTQRNSVESKHHVEVERNLQATLLDLKRLEMEKLTLHRCVATLTEKCAKLQAEKGE